MKRLPSYLPLVLAFLLGALVALASQRAVRVVSLHDPVPQGGPTTAPSGTGWIDLLAQDRAAAWKNVTDGRNLFVWEDGMLHLLGKSVYPLRYIGYTARDFGDFELHVEFRVAPGANSGIFLRATPDDPVQRGFEVQILDDHGRPPSKNGSGAIYDVVTPMYNLARPAGEWNSYDIRVEGSEVSVVMNGYLVVEADFALLSEPVGKFDIAYADLRRSGMLMIQDHGGEVWFRDIRIRPLDTKTPPAQ